MRSFRFRTFYVSTLVLAGGLQLSCGSGGGAESEAIGSAQQAVSCTTAADCTGYFDSCDLYVICYKPNRFLPGFCQFADKPNGSACDDGNPCTQTDTCQSGVCGGSNPLPPQDACWDNQVDPNLPTTVFLWEGDGSIQSGVAAGTIDENRVAIRGQVKDRNGTALTGVGITIVGHSEYGSTSTLGAEGWFDMVVNGGGDLIVKPPAKSPRTRTADWGGSNRAREGPSSSGIPPTGSGTASGQAPTATCRNTTST